MLVIFLSIVFSLYAQSPIPSGAKVEVIATNIIQPEGPVWNDSLGLLFSDIQGNKIYCWNPIDKTLKSYIDTSYNSNGLTYDLQGRLILTQMGLRRISRQESDGSITPIATTYNGKKLNCPNDLVVKSDGSIFFTDPDFNIPVGGTKEIFINGAYIKGVYRINPKGDIQLLDATFDKPNGICFSPDEKKIYVNESPKGEIYVWDVVNDTAIADKKLFYKIPLSGYVDGMKVDPDGNLYCTGPTGVWIISPAGEYLDKIVVQNQSPSNCAWGDADRKTLYITSGTSVYKIRLANPTDIEEKHGSILPNNFELFRNYPNPFNPETIISYRLSTFSKVSLKVYDLLGREVETLVNQEQRPGNYNSKFSINNLPAGRQSFQLGAGVYFYTLIAGDFTKTKKIVLIK